MKAARGSRYKLIRFNGQADEMYDLASDPFEEVNLLHSDSLVWSGDVRSWPVPASAAHVLQRLHR